MSPTGTPTKSAINECILKTVSLSGNNDGWMGWQQARSGMWGENTLGYPNLTPAFPGLGKS